MSLFLLSFYLFFSVWAIALNACFVNRWIPQAAEELEGVNGASHTPHGPNDTAAVSDSTSLPMTPHSPPTPLVDLLSDSQSGLEYLTDSNERKKLTAGTFLFVL